MKKNGGTNMLKKMVKITAVLLVLCLAVAAIAVFADSADCYLNKNQYYNKSGYAYGNYATGYLDNYSTSTCSVRANLYGDGGHLAGYVGTTPARHRNSPTSPLFPPHCTEASLRAAYGS